MLAKVVDWSFENPIKAILIAVFIQMSTAFLYGILVQL